MTADAVARLPSSNLRIARPARELERAEKFWVQGLGMTVLYRAAPDTEDGHALLMAGWPGAAWHLELIGDPDGQVPPSSTEEDLLVLHLGVRAGDALIERLVGAGGKVVPARNPYWDR